MSFHKNLNADDLHAPSILLIENDGETTINPGEVLFVTGYNRITRRYKVRRAIELPNIVLSERALIYGISNVLIPTITDRGTMVAFGIVEDLEVIETPNTALGANVPITNNAPIFIDIDVNSTNVGNVVTGTRGQTVEAGVIIDIVSAGVVTAFVFSLTAGFVDFAETRALKANIPFNTYDTSIWTINNIVDPTSIEATIEHNLDRRDFVVQFYEYINQPDPTDPLAPIDINRGTQFGALDIDWKTDDTLGGDELNNIIVSIPESVTRFAGYIEIIY